MTALPYLVPDNVPEKKIANGRASAEELTQLAIKLRGALHDCADKLGERQDFAQVMIAAGELIMAITESDPFPLPGSSPKKAADSTPYSGGRGCIPVSLH